VSFNAADGNFPLVYDIESDTNTAAVNAFLGGWDQQLHSDGFTTVGAYGSTCAGNVHSWESVSPVPDFVWMADYHSPSRNTVWGLDCDPGGWTWDQRHSQYRGTHSRTYNGVALTIDSDCANGPVWSAPGWTYGDADPSGEASGASEDDYYWCPNGVL
jgi:hypothetical protein